MSPDLLLKHFDQISGAPEAVRHIWRFYVGYYDRAVQIPQIPSGELVPKKSQMVSGQSQNTLPEPSVQIAQTMSAQFAATFSMKKRLMEWAEAAVQNKSGGR